MNLLLNFKKSGLISVAIAALAASAVAADPSKENAPSPAPAKPAVVEKSSAPAPIIRFKGLTHQLTISYVRSNPGYALWTGNSFTDTHLSGYGVQYTYRKYYPVDIIGLYRYERGGLMKQTLQTFAAGAGYTHPIGRFAPMIQGAAGFARTSSNHQMYLYSGSRSGLATLVGAGVDVKLHNGWGVRPFYAEYEYLPFGQIKSKYWNYTTGVFYRFHQGVGHSQK